MFINVNVKFNVNDNGGEFSLIGELPIEENLWLKGCLLM
jgi:hypothetical protein